MKTVGLFDAKTRLSELCREVADTGGEFVITRRGIAIARLVPPAPKEELNPYLALGIAEALAAWETRHGAPPDDEADFPDVWLERSGGRPNPVSEE